MFSYPLNIGIVCVGVKRISMHCSTILTLPRRLGDTARLPAEMSNIFISPPRCRLAWVLS